MYTYHNHHFGVELNASTADFNKEIKQINQQLMNEGHLLAVEPTPAVNIVPTKIVLTDSPVVTLEESEESVTRLD